jgi:DNA-binding HxlR family transcriptional regulator
MSRQRTEASGRSYRQYCAVARGLDVVGERWTLLIVRDLLTGPKRYKDLLEGLPGIGTNLLAARLREMEHYGIVNRRVLPPPAGSTVYELTELGQALEPAVTALGRWGHHFLGARREGDFLSANAYLLAMRGTFRPDRAQGVTARYELHVGEQVFEVTVNDGRCTTREGQPASADMVIRTDVDTLGALLGGEISAAKAVARGRVAINRDVAELERFVSMFALRPPATGAGLTGHRRARTRSA